MDCINKMSPHAFVKRHFTSIALNFETNKQWFKTQNQGPFY